MAPTLGLAHVAPRRNEKRLPSRRTPARIPRGRVMPTSSWRRYPGTGVTGFPGRGSGPGRRDRARLADVVDTASTGTRYRMHDLVRLYAPEHACGEQTADDLHAAVVRSGATTPRLVQRGNVSPPLSEQRLRRTQQPAEAARMVGAAGPARP